jgi:hypothetical protein
MQAMRKNLEIVHQRLLQLVQEACLPYSDGWPQAAQGIGAFWDTLCDPIAREAEATLEDCKKRTTQEGASMNGYLVVACCEGDDFPVQFFESRREAAKLARDLTVAKLLQEYAKELSIHYTSLVERGITRKRIVQFKNGRILAVSIVK